MIPTALADVKENRAIQSTEDYKLRCPLAEYCDLSMICDAGGCRISFSSASAFLKNVLSILLPF